MIINRTLLQERKPQSQTKQFIFVFAFKTFSQNAFKIK